MLIRNARIVLKDSVVDGDLRVCEGKIAEICPGSCPAIPGEAVIDAGMNYLMPGFVDLHTHGAGGYDFMDGSAADILGAADMLMRHGTTTCLPTTLTCADDDLFSFIDNFKKLRELSSITCRMPGLHLEGPYFDMIQKGAQDPRYVRNPERSHYMAILERADGCISRWSLAPELEGSVEFMDELSDNGIVISAGHTAATYDDISKAMDHGLRMLTHFYSGMSSLTRRNGFRILGTIESGYLIDDLYVELICDGMHLPPDLLEMIFKLKRHDRITACSDSMRGAGMGEGPSILGPKKNGTPVIIEDGIAKMPDRSCFAGSVATGDRLARTLHRIAGLDLCEVTRLLSLQPAEIIGMDSQIGSIEEGKLADLVICDEDINVQKVFIGGTEVCK